MSPRARAAHATNRSREHSQRAPARTVPRLLRRLAALWLAFRHRVLGRRHRRLVLERLDGVPLVVLPDVFNPVLLRTGAVLARAVAALHPPDTGAARGESRTALDMGTGSGVGAVFAARAGYRVVAVDVSPEAVRCARMNALLNRVEERVDVREGDLFAPVAGERYDLVLFNPPFFRGRPRDAHDHAWRSPDVLERFAAELPEHLTPDGLALVVLSTDGEGEALLAAFERAGLAFEAVAREDLWNEVVTVYAVGRRGAGYDSRAGGRSRSLTAFSTGNA